MTRDPFLIQKLLLDRASSVVHDWAGSARVGHSLYSVIYGVLNSGASGKGYLSKAEAIKKAANIVKKAERLVASFVQGTADESDFLKLREDIYNLEKKSYYDFSASDGDPYIQKILDLYQNAEPERRRVRAEQQNAEMRRLREAARAEQKPYEWMRSNRATRAP